MQGESRLGRQRITADLPPNHIQRTFYSLVLDLLGMAGTLDTSPDANRLFTPSLVSPDRFARVEHLVREATNACAPPTRQRARDFTRYGTYLATWCDAEYMPLRLEVVFHPDTVERFVAVLETSLAPRSVATIASVLRAMSALLLPAISPSSLSHHPGRRPKPPYSYEEVEELFSLIERARSRKRRHDLAALLVLCLATGASGQEAALVGGRDLVVSPTAITVNLRRRKEKGGWRERQVVALAKWGDVLTELKVAPDDYMIGGGNARHSRVYDLCVCTRGDRWPVELDPGRARSTYLVEVGCTANTVPELLERAGVSTLEAYNGLIGFMKAHPEGM